MNIIEYLEAKYGQDGPRIVTAMEAKAFGIKYPLQSGWLEKHGAQDIAPAVAAKLAVQLYEKGMRSEDTSKANNCLAGAAVLKKIGGVSTHAAGPWKLVAVDAESPVTIYSASSVPIAVMCTSRKTPEMRSTGEYMAAARLITAAPALLAELNTVAFHLRRDDFKNNESLCQQALDSIEATILLATGSAS